MLYKFLSGGIDQSLGARQVRVIASTGSIDHEGEILCPDGCDLAQYRRNPIVLADHDARQPIGSALVELINGRIEATIEFAPAGVSEKADTYCGLMKAGVLKAVSVGMLPVQIDKPKAKGDPVVYRKWRLLEISVVAVPANPDAMVIARAHRPTDRDQGRKKRLRMVEALAYGPGPDGPPQKTTRREREAALRALGTADFSRRRDD